mmetsp:Transcript_10916/g.32464  ORF Transcript_10916/g.32464 Transcript_10916/m.32464 type:complete len:292 (+) Transcript_10916:1392-2267(+)
MQRLRVPCPPAPAACQLRLAPHSHRSRRSSPHRDRVRVHGRGCGRPEAARPAGLTPRDASCPPFRPRRSNPGHAATSLQVTAAGARSWAKRPAAAQPQAARLLRQRMTHGRECPTRHLARRRRYPARQTLAAWASLPARPAAGAAGLPGKSQPTETLPAARGGALPCGLTCSRASGLQTSCSLGSCSSRRAYRLQHPRRCWSQQTCGCRRRAAPQSLGRSPAAEPPGPPAVCCARVLARRLGGAQRSRCRACTPCHSCKAGCDIGLGAASTRICCVQRHNRRPGGKRRPSS